MRNKIPWKTFLSSVLLILALKSFLLSAGFGTLVNYSFIGVPGNQLQISPITTNSNLTASPLTRGTGLMPNEGSDCLNSSDWSTGGTDFNDYYGFVITPNAGYEVDLTTLAFSERRSKTGIANFQVRVSVDNFASFITLSTIAVPDDTSTRSQNIDLTGVSLLQNQTNPVTFRLYGYNAKAIGGTWRLDSSLSVSGEISRV